MENASKALIMAGIVLISVMLISLFMYVFTAIMEFQTDSQAQLQSNQSTAFNRFFVETHDINYSKSGIQVNGYDIYNIIRKVDDINNDENSEIIIDKNLNGIDLDDFKSGDYFNPHTMKEVEYTYSYTIGDDGYIKSVSFIRE